MTKQPLAPSPQENISATPPARRAFDVRDLRADLHSASRCTRAAPVSVKARRAEVAHLQDTVQRWLPLAKDRLAKAQPSPADTARWTGLLAPFALHQPDSLTEAAFLVLARAARALLQALVDTTPPCTTVPRAGQMIEAAIHDGRLPFATLYPARDLAARLALPQVTAELAAQDLAQQGALMVRSGRVQIGSRDEWNGRRALHLAARITSHRAAGVYPAGAPLPSRAELARIYVTEQDVVGRALHHLKATSPAKLHPQDASAGARTQAGLPPSAASPEAEAPAPPRTAARKFTPDEITNAVHTARTQWRSRPVISATTLLAQWQQLREMAAFGQHRATALRMSDEPSVVGVLARAAETAEHPLPAEPWQRLWHLACLATSVADLLAATAERGEGA